MSHGPGRESVARRLGLRLPRRRREVRYTYEAGSTVPRQILHLTTISSSNQPGRRLLRAVPLVETCGISHTVLSSSSSSSSSGGKTAVNSNQKIKKCPAQRREKIDNGAVANQKPYMSNDRRRFIRSPFPFIYQCPRTPQGFC